MTIPEKIQSLITAANTATGESDTTLTDAVQALVDGYGQGESLSLIGSGTFTVATVASQITIPVSVNGTIKYAYVEKDVEEQSLGQMLKWVLTEIDSSATELYNWHNQFSESYYVNSNGRYGFGSRSNTPGGQIISITDGEILIRQYSNNYRIQPGSYTWKIWGVAAT